MLLQQGDALVAGLDALAQIFDDLLVSRHIGGPLQIGRSYLTLQVDDVLVARVGELNDRKRAAESVVDPLRSAMILTRTLS